MQVKIKKLCDNAVIPAYAHENSDAGLDLVATSRGVDGDGNIVYGTGLAFEIPQGYVGLVFPRSSIAKKDLVLSNAVGVIDSGYRGEVTFKFKPVGKFGYCETCKAAKRELYEIGDRIGQMIILPYPKIEFIEADELSETDRGTGGYGSTGA